MVKLFPESHPYLTLDKCVYFKDINMLKQKESLLLVPNNLYPDVYLSESKQVAAPTGIKVERTDARPRVQHSQCCITVI